MVEEIFIWDDIAGFVNEEHYKKFCHPVSQAHLRRVP